MTDINSNYDRLVAEGQEGLAELTETLNRKIAALESCKWGRGAEEQARLTAKIRGVETGLQIAQSPETVSPFSAYWAMRQLISSAPENERPGLEIAIQDAMLISRL